MARQRRPKGEGSVYEAPKGSGRWWARLPQDAQGNRPKKRAKSEAEAYKVLRQMEHAREQGLTIKRRPLFKEYALLWLEEHEKHVKETSHNTYVSRINRTLIPQFGNQRLSAIQRPGVQRWVNTYCETHAANTVRNDLKLLETILEHAVTDRVIAFNPCKDVRLPKESRDTPSRKAVALTFAQVDTFLTIAASDRLYALYFLALTTGMREGELLGLHWKNVPLDAKQPIIRVVEQLQSVRNKQQSASSKQPARKTKLAIIAPKSKKSIRDIPIDAEVVAVLRTHHARQAAERLRAGAEWQHQNLVFPAPSGVPMRAETLRNQFYALIERADLEEMRFHDLRHTCGSLMLDRGIDLLTVSNLLGHSSVAVTASTYAHDYEENRLQAVSAVTDGIRRVRGAI